MSRLTETLDEIEKMELNPSAKSPALKDGLAALQTLSKEWRDAAEVTIAPPKDGIGVKNYDVYETLLDCADKLDGLIKEMSN